MTFESKLQPGIYVIGDAASAGDMPKSAFTANSQAKVCAFAIAAALTGSEQFPPHLFNTCFTLLAPNDAVSDAISFRPLAGSIKITNIYFSQVGESAETRRKRRVSQTAGMPRSPTTYSVDEAPFSLARSQD